MAFVLFRNIEDGTIAEYPEHYAEHPQLGALLERYYPEDEEWEEDKVVSDDHNLPVEQRAYKTAVAKTTDEAVVATDEEETD